MAVPRMDVNSQICKTTLSRYQKSLCSPLVTRCQELKQLMQEASLRDLQGLFPLLITNIFGFQEPVDWGLTILTRNNNPRDFEIMRNFLHPDGPVFVLSYRLLAEGCPQFEFPTSCLPTHSGQTLEENPFSSMFSSRLSGQTLGSLPSSLRLNAFEFYFFHFAYYITRQETEKILSQYPDFDSSAMLYAILLEEYFSYFLPLEGGVPAIPFAQSVLSASGQQISMLSPFSSSIPQSHFSSLGSPLRSNPAHRSLLRHRPGLLKPGTPLSVPPSSGTGGPGTVESSPAEIWRSEAFVFILAEMYLNQNTQAMQRNRPVSFLEAFIPNTLHVWVLRTFIKYLHYFSNSTKSSSHPSSYAHLSLNVLEQLKCTVIQKFIRKKFYKFMKCTFDHWPLDASFKLPLEAWLSYIQPWRYVSQSRIFMDEKNGNFDSKWQKFVSDNILFYTVMFHQVLKKFLRMDLGSPRNAFMVYRFSKVFNQSIVTSSVRDVENCPQDTTSKSPSSILLSPNYSSIRRSEMLPSSSIRQQLSDLETSSCEYVSLFSPKITAEVSQLLKVIGAARRKTHQRSRTCHKNGVSWLSQLANYFSFESKYIYRDSGSADVRKVDQSLEVAAQNFCELFDLQMPDFSTLHLSSSSNDRDPLLSSLTSTPAKKGAKESDELNQQQRYQLMNGLKIADVKYQGNPDTQPIRTYEIAFLVRMMWKISTFLNMKFSREIEDLYHRCDIFGRMCHQLLSPPVTYYKILKSGSLQSSPKVPVHLPPRVNLRYLANKQIVGYFLLLLTAAMFFGYHPVTVVLFVFFGMLLLVFFRALVTSPKTLRHVS